MYLGGGEKDVASVEIEIKTIGDDTLSMKPRYRLTYQQYMNNEFVDENITLKSLDHELKHLMNSYHQKMKVKQDNGEKQYQLRTGLSLYNIELQTGLRLSSKDYRVVSEENRMLEELCNEIACQDTEPILFSLAQMPIRYLDINKYCLERFNSQSESTYRLAVPPMRPILENLGRELEDSRYYGQIDQFKNYYNDICQSSFAFRNLSRTLDMFLEESIEWHHDFNEYIRRYENGDIITLRALKQVVEPFQKNFQSKPKLRVKQK